MIKLNQESEVKMSNPIKINTYKTSIIAMLLSALILFITILIIVFAPKTITILGLNRGHIMAIHKLLGVILSLLIINHLRTKITVIKSYIKSSTNGKFPSKEFITALILVIISVIIAITIKPL